MQSLAFAAHLVGPDARLYLADVCFAQVYHAEARLADAASDAERQRTLHEPLVKVKVQPFFLARFAKLTDESFAVYADTHRRQFDGAFQHVIPDEQVTVQSR